MPHHVVSAVLNTEQQLGKRLHGVGCGGREDVSSESTHYTEAHWPEHSTVKPV